MADEKLNTSPEENPQPSLFDTGPAEAPTPEAPTPEPPAPENAPEQTGGEPPAQDAPAGAPGAVNVSADQIEKLMAEQRAAGRAEVEKNEPPEPEQPPTPAPEEKAAVEKEPEKKGKAAKEKTPEPDKPKGRRGRKPKEEKAGPGEPGGTEARRGRPAKADKAAPDRPPSQPRDKMSQSKGGKAATVKGKEEAPAAPAPEQPPQPRDATRAEKEEIVYLKLSELFPFKDHPFGVRDDAEMKGLVESVKDNGVHQPALVRPREGGGYEIIAGHRRQRASELAGFANMPCIVRNMTDDEAILAMTDDNLRHREKILPMEKAQSLKMQVEAISHQGTKMEGVAAGDVGKRSTEIVGERNGMNYKQVQRYIRLTELVPELQSIINLRDFYYWYTQDEYMEVTDDVAEALRASVRYEAAYQRRLSRHKAQYSLDCEDGIEYSACLRELTPDEVLELKERFCRLWNALNSLPPAQGRRVDACIILGKSFSEVALAEGVDESAVRRAVERGLENMKKFLKNSR